MAPQVVVPPVTTDPRFRAGRQLVQIGKAGEGAIEIFETLVQEARREFGEASVEAAACYFEYGNALFRAAARRSADQTNEPDESEDTKPAAQPQAGESPQELEKGTDHNKEETNKDEDVEDEDVDLALEMMETAWSVLDKYVNEDSHSSNGDSKSNYVEWASDQLPRILVAIGDVLSSLDRNADAADAYSRAIPHREAAVEGYDKNNNLELEHLKKRRQLVEANVLVAEALLECPENEDVVTSETNDLLVKASERIEYARGYYDKARDELQEAVFLMGKIAASGKDLASEKEDVCFISTLLMGVGTTLAELDEKAVQDVDAKPAAKKQKT